MPVSLLVALALGGGAKSLSTALTDTTFWDDNWHRVGRRNAVYYGWTVPLDSGRCRILDFYLTGERQMEAFGHTGPPIVKDGPATYYYRSGVKKAAGQYTAGKHDGLWQYWWEDGRLKRQIQWRKGIASSNSDSAARKIIAQYVMQMPKFPGPLSVGAYLATTVHHPPGPLPGGLSQGKVYVEFVVGPEGTVTSARIIKGFAPAYDAEALRAVAALPRWKPGLQNDQAVPVRMTIAITFQ